MTRKNNLLVALTLLALLVLTAAPAAAKGKPPKPDPIPDGMCTEQVTDIADAPTMTGPDDCIDVLSSATTAWDFSVEITGRRPESVNSVYLSLREAHPGDFCWTFTGNPATLDDNPTDSAITFVVTTGEIPASEKNACSGDPAGEDPTESMVATLVTTGSKGSRNAATLVTIRPTPGP